MTHTAPLSVRRTKETIGTRYGPDDTASEQLVSDQSSVDRADVSNHWPLINARGIARETGFRDALLPAIIRFVLCLLFPPFPCANGALKIGERSIKDFFKRNC